jgi:hypothetical protein
LPRPCPPPATDASDRPGTIVLMGFALN